MYIKRNHQTMNNRNVAKLTVICWYETIKMIWFKGTSALEMTLWLQCFWNKLCLPPPKHARFFFLILIIDQIRYVCVCVCYCGKMSGSMCMYLASWGWGGSRDGPLGTMYSYFWLLICSERMLIFTLLSMESGQYVLIKYVIFAQREFIHDISIG